MSETSPSSSSEGSDATLVNQTEFDVYLQAVFGYLDPQHYDIVSSNLRVIKYSEDSPDFWSCLGHFIRFASKYQLLLNEDLVLVIQDGANICDEIVSYLQKSRVKYKYLVGLANCFIISMLSKPHEAASNKAGKRFLDESGFGSRVDAAGSYEIFLRLHSMHDICSTVFINLHTVEKAQKVVANKKRDGLGTKLPDYTAYPTYLPLIRFIQGAPTIPTFMIETGMSDQTVKVEVDCISIILGVGFNVEAVLGIHLKVNQASQELGSMGLIVFDVSVGAMFDLFNSLVDSYEKALVSMVLKRKAQFKKDEVEAICQLKECIDGDGDYDSLCNNIAKQYRRRMKHDRMRHLNAPEIPDKELTRIVLNDFGFKTAELIAEGNYYQDLINRCNEALGYFGVQELLDPDTIRKAEAFMIQQLYRRRKVQTVTAEVQQDLILPTTALSSTHWRKQKKIVLTPAILKRCFGEISLHCTKNRVE
uniref:ARAD1C15730p n=1 Tax=Blastobotrys adeninivorans TaxID=409370 RepID=A0A060T0D9_BLAAD